MPGAGGALGGTGESGVSGGKAGCRKQEVIVITPQKLEDPLLSLGSALLRQTLYKGAKKHDEYIYGAAIPDLRKPLNTSP